MFCHMTIANIKLMFPLNPILPCERGGNSDFNGSEMVLDHKLPQLWGKLQRLVMLYGIMGVERVEKYGRNFNNCFTRLAADEHM